MSSRNPLLPFLVTSIVASSFLVVSTDACARSFTLYEQALEDLDESRYDKAEEKLRRVVAQEPNNAAAFADLARVYMNTDDMPKMAQALKRALELDDKLCRAYANRSYMNFRSGRMKEGLADSQKAIDLYVVNPHDWSVRKVYANRALVYDRAGARAQAQADREKEHVFELLDQAGKFREVGRLPDTVKRIDEGLALEPTNADLWFFRGLTKANMMKFWDAIADFNRALRFAPQATMLYYFRGDCYQQLGKHQQAIDDFTRVIKAGEPIVAYRFVCETGRLREQLLRDDTSCVSLNDVYFLRSQSYQAIGKLQAAVKDLDYIATRDKTDDKALAKRAEIAAGMGKSDDSIKDLTRAIYANTKDWKNYMNRAQAYLRLGKDDDAIADFTKVVELEPGDPGSFIMRAGAYKSMGRYDDALADYSKVLSMKEDSDILMERADCYRAVRRYDDAKKDLDRAVEMDRSNAVLARTVRAKILQEKGEDESARFELLELEKQRQVDVHKNDSLNLALCVSGVVFALGLVFLLVRFWKKRAGASAQTNH